MRKATARGLAVTKRSVEELAQSQQGQYDAVFSFQVLEHVSRPAEFIRAARELLKPGGILVISVPSEDSLLVDAVNNVFNMPPHYVTRWSDKELQNLGAMMNLEVRDLEHESLSEVNIQGFAKAQLFRCLYAPFARRVPLVKRILVRRTTRVLTFALSLPFKLYFKMGLHRPVGHSVTLVYQKPQQTA